MIKKFVSRALLSVVMDKKAREALDKRRAAKAGPDAAPAAGKSKATKAKTAATAKAAPTPPSDDLLDDLPETLIRQAIGEAEREISRRKTAAGNGPGSERARLIQEALDIQQKKSKLLDELPPAQREKLIVMAHQALIGDVEKAQAVRAKKAKKKPPKGKG